MTKIQFNKKNQTQTVRNLLPYSEAAFEIEIRLFLLRPENARGAE